MNVQPITAPPEVAKQKLKAYRADRHADADAVYRRCEAAYAALAEGTPILDVQLAIAEAPTDEKGRPMLAISRADRKQVEIYWRSQQRQCTFNTNLRSNRWYPQFEMNFDMGRENQNAGVWSTRGYCRVPMVPADARPPKGQLRDWFVLFEVEKWHDKPVIDPPRDPLLLKHLDGTLYAILAEWDLTELERAVMRQAMEV